MRGFYVTKLKRDVLALLVVYEYLTITDLYLLLDIRNDDTAERYLRDALKSMTTEYHLLARHEIKDPVKQKGQWRHYEFMYWMTPKGYDLAVAQGLDPDRVGTGHKVKSPLMLPHERERSRFHILLNQAAGSPVWWRGSGLRQEFLVDKVKRSITPDDLFFYKRYYRFLEIENGKKGDYRGDGTGIMDKVQKYFDYADKAHKHFQVKWPKMNDFYVNIVMKTSRRRDNLLTALKELKNARFHVTTFDEYRADILGPIWKTHDGKTHSL